MDNDNIDYEQSDLLNDLGLKIANLTLENSILKAKLADRERRLSALEQSDKQ
ncbi:hypothetical protein JS533_001730 [Bifidobacterium amazonense]|uniref:Transposase n=1 Tax=Bifidobacterium amazonense TaxID=2809027 RepID=A0ABS9VSE7_9BIFI|nr:hypothetical protein [Bifidobacterium amazonense]MCH9275009.1 hypothetical protein [Bifidobacterium amazonense]